MLLVSLSCVAQDGQEEWRRVAASNLIVMELDEGEVLVELNPAFAPLTVARFKRLVRKGFYDGQSFYRVIDGFVAQGGDGSDMGIANDEPMIPAEFDRAWSDNLRYTTVQSPDLYASETGIVDGFPVGRDREEGRIWLAHCPGAVAMARGVEPASSSTDFYIVIGQAPRYLDRNLTIFGRVVVGWTSCSESAGATPRMTECSTTPRNEPPSGRFVSRKTWNRRHARMHAYGTRRATSTGNFWNRDATGSQISFT